MKADFQTYSGGRYYLINWPTEMLPLSNKTREKKTKKKYKKNTRGSEHLVHVIFYSLSAHFTL